MKCVPLEMILDITVSTIMTPSLTHTLFPHFLKQALFYVQLIYIQNIPIVVEYITQYINIHTRY